MELLPYDKFTRLRLRDFDSTASDARELGGSACFEFLGLYWFEESSRGVEFLRQEDDPKRLGGIGLDFRYVTRALATSILTAVRLQLRRGMTIDEVDSVLGVGSTGSGAAPGYVVRNFECGLADRYRIMCYFTNSEGLHGVDIIRADLLKE